MTAGQRIVRGLDERGWMLEGRRALEIFGGDGHALPHHYGRRVATLEIWELDPRLEPQLRRSFPDATIRITDSFAEIKRSSGPFDLVVCDNYVTPREHFDLFPDVLRLLSDDSVLIVYVVPCVDDRTREIYPGILSAEHLAARARFYDAEAPDRLNLADLARAYARHADPFGLRLEWWFAEGTTELHGFRPVRIAFRRLVMRFVRATPADGAGSASPSG